jgi:hypothetical protein
MSAEASAEEKFARVRESHIFLGRLGAFGVDADQVVVVADSTPVGEVLAQVGQGGVVAVLDEAAPHGFALARITGVDG